MQIRILSVAQKMPAWVDAACDDYRRRLPREINLELLSLPLNARDTKGTPAQSRTRQSELLLGKIEPGSFTIALDEGGKPWSSRDWAAQLDRWMQQHPRVNLLIGGPDGLSERCLQACQQRVSLGRMTLPHALVRVVLLEQIYRAWTILQGHPYHRD